VDSRASRTHPLSNPDILANLQIHLEKSLRAIGIDWMVRYHYSIGTPVLTDFEVVRMLARKPNYISG
jgi:hypothetical protein